MDKYELMLEWYPEKKGTITRLQNLERKQLMEFIQKVIRLTLQNKL